MSSAKEVKRVKSLYEKDVDRLETLFQTLETKINRRSINKEAVEICFPGGVQTVNAVLQKARNDSFPVATAHWEILRAIALAEQIRDGLHDKTCQLIASTPNKRAQKQALAAMRRMRMDTQAEIAQKRFENAHASVADLVCQKGTARKVGRPVSTPKRRSSPSPAPAHPVDDIPSDEDEDEQSEVSDNDEFDNSDGWLVDDEDVEEDAVAEEPDMNDMNFLQIRARHAQTALDKQEQYIKDAKARLAVATDPHEIRGLKAKIETLQMQDIKMQKKIIDDAARAAMGVKITPRQGGEVQISNSFPGNRIDKPINILIPRKKVPAQGSKQPARAPAPRPASPAPRPASPTPRHESQKKVPKRTPEEWKAWIKKIKAGKKTKRRASSAVENTQVVCVGNTCAKKPDVIIISSD